MANVNGKDLTKVEGWTLVLHQLLEEQENPSRNWPEHVLRAMHALRDELNVVLGEPLKTEDTTYEALKVGDFYLNSNGVRKRKIQLDKDVASVAVNPAYNGYASCPPSSQAVKKIIFE